MILALFKKTLRQNWILLVIFFGVLSMYTSVMLSMYDPQSMEGLLLMIDAFPEALRAAMGFEYLPADLAGYLASWLYGMLMIGFPMVYSIILGNRLVAKMVDNGSFAYLLSTPHTRVKIIITQGIYALLSMLVLFIGVFIVGITMSASLFPGALDVMPFFHLNLTTMLVNMVVLMITFFFSCVFNETKLSLGFGSGLPITFLLLKMLGDSSTDLKILSDISIFGFYNPVKVSAGEPTLMINLIYICIILVLFTSAVLIFNKKRLPL